MNHEGTAPSILIVEDEAIVALHLRTELEAFGYEVLGVVARSDEVIFQVQVKRPSLVLMDIHLKGSVDGVTLAEELFVCEDTPVVFLSAFFDAEIIQRAAHSGAYGFMTKPVTPATLVSTIELAVHKHKERHAPTGDANWLSGALDSVDFAVIGVDANERLRFMNKAAVQLSGSRLREARKTAPAWLADLVAAEVEPGGERNVTLHFRDGTPVSVSLRRFRVHGGGSLNILRVR